MGEEQWVTVAVPVGLVRDVYRLILESAGPNTPPSSGALADPAVVARAYEESSVPMKAFLDLLAAHPGEWLDIDTVRTELGLGVHELAGVLSTFPRRWRGRYKQAGPMPYEQEGKGSQRRYRMGRELAELITALG